MTTTLTREQRHMALETARMDADGDPWGWCMSHVFAVADVLYHNGEDLPYRWHYRHPSSDAGVYCGGPEQWPGTEEETEGASWPEHEYVPFLDAGELGVAMLTYVGDVMDRYSRFVKRAGKDY